MKSFSTYILLSLLALPLLAQVGFHKPLDGDRVVKTQYEFVAVDADSMVWDFSHAVETGREHPMAWFNMGDTVLVRVEQGHQYIYHVQGDTMLWKSYETALLGMRDSIAPVAWLRFMEPGDSVSTPYYFRGKYSGNHAVDMAGWHCVQVRSLGTLILPNDTIADAMLVREVTDGKVRVSPELTDASISADNDSLLRHRVVTDRWYSPSHRYPVAENVTSTFYVLGEQRQQTHATYLCSPEVQNLALGEMSTPRQSAPRQQNNAPSGNSSDVVYDHNLPLGDRMAVNVGDGQVSVAVSGTDGTEVAVILSDIQGRMWALRSGKTQGGIWQGTVNTSHMPTGDYLLRISVGKESEVERFKIR